MAEYSRMAKGNFTAVGTSAVVNLPFLPDFVQIWNYTNFKTQAVNKVTQAFWDNSLVDSTSNPTMVQIYNATGSGVLVDDVILSNGIGVFSAGQMLQYGARQQIIGATAADPIVFNVTAHGYSVGDVVIFEGLYQSATTGMPQISGIPFTITVVGDADHFSVKWNGSQSNYTALSGSPSGAYVKKVLYPYIYLPGVSFIEAITVGATTTIVTTSEHNLVVGQEVAFRIPDSWGTIQLNSLPNLLTPGAPAYGYVISVTNARTVVVNINSSSYTAYNSNQTVASVPGLSFPQMVAVGDVNSGGVQISAGSPLYPSPKFLKESGAYSSTINGPAIQGAFVNNTSQGFTIGAGLAATDTSAKILIDGDKVFWRAFLHDFANP